MNAAPKDIPNEPGRDPRWYWLLSPLLGIFAGILGGGLSGVTLFVLTTNVLSEPAAMIVGIPYLFLVGAIYGGTCGVMVGVMMTPILIAFPRRSILLTGLAILTAACLSYFWFDRQERTPTWEPGFGFMLLRVVGCAAAAGMSAWFGTTPEQEQPR